MTHRASQSNPRMPQNRSSIPTQSGIEKHCQKSKIGSSFGKISLANTRNVITEKKKFHPDELTMDHKISLSRGGKSIKKNVVPSCKNCNQNKKHLLPLEVEI